MYISVCIENNWLLIYLYACQVRLMSSKGYKGDHKVSFMSQPVHLYTNIPWVFWHCLGHC